MKTPGCLRRVLVLVALCTPVAVAVPLLAAVVVPAAVRIPKTHPHPTGTPQESALFSHQAHGGMGCYTCHPSIFPQAAWAFSHEDMRAGRACGSCHDGRRAPAVTAFACGACHVP